MEESFLQNILRFYGESDSLSTGNLENFLRLITSRSAASVDDDASPLRDREVMRMCPIWDTLRLIVSVRIFPIVI